MIWRPLVKKRRESPLTDPRSLALTLIVHALILAAASLVVTGGTWREEPDESTPLRGEIGPVDNRVVERSGGGRPGDLGDSPRIVPDGSARTTDQDYLARLSDAASRSPAQALPRTDLDPTLKNRLEQRSAIGAGLFGLEGLGGGGGSGGGAGGGVGRGIGPGTTFFGARERASSYAYVIDRSGSMSLNESLGVAKRELLNSLSRIDEKSRFGVVFYNLEPTVLVDSAGNPTLMSATQSNKNRTRELLDKMAPAGGTDHVLALRAAFKLHAEAIFFLTDGDMMTQKEADMIAAEAGKSRIHVVEFGVGPPLGGARPLKRLAAAAGGSYRYIDVDSFK
jgi:hypothetical protein